MSRFATIAALVSGEVLAHPGHGAAPVHLHGWDYALLVIAIIAVAGVAWFRARK